MHFERAGGETLGFRLFLRDAKADARHQERVAEERRTLRDKRREREERRAAGPRVPRGTVNFNTLGLRLMVHIEPTARPDVAVPVGKSLLDVVGAAKEPIIYAGGSSGHGYVVLTPPPLKYEIGAKIELLIVRGPKPFRRAVAAVTLEEYGQADDVRLPEAVDWVETECGDLILDYAREMRVHQAERMRRCQLRVNRSLTPKSEAANRPTCSPSSRSLATYGTPVCSTRMSSPREEGRAARTSLTRSFG